MSYGVLSIVTSEVEGQVSFQSALHVYVVGIR